MNIKKGVYVNLEDPFYDLFEGGYIKPSELLESTEDVEEVSKAMDVIEQFLCSLEDHIADLQ